jgi:hypothetical protein
MRGTWGCVAVACSFLLLPAPPAFAGGCYTASSYSYGYHAYPASYAYYPSTYYYAEPYYPPKVRYEVNEVVVPKALKAFINPDFYSSTSDYYKEKVLLDAVAGKAGDTEKLRSEIQELKAALKAQPQQPAPQGYYPPPQYPYAPQQYAPQQPGYQPQGGTPCDWRAAQAAQQAYQQGLAQGQQQGGYPQGYPGGNQGYPGGNPSQAQGSYPPQGQGYQQPAQPQQPGAAPAQPPPPASSPGYGGGGRGSPPESNGGNGAGAPLPAPRGNDAPAPLPPAGGGRPPEAEARADHEGVPDGLQQVVNEACIRCHGPKNEEMGAGFDLTNLAAVPPEGRMESYAQVLAGAMPHKSAKLPREKARLFREWFRAATQTRKVAAVR